MSIIGKNIKKIRVVKKISQSDFAGLFDLSRGSVGSYEEGRAEPKIDTIIKIASHFGLSVDVLLTKELTVNELYKFDIFKEEYASEDIQQLIVQDRDVRREDTPLVARSNFLEYVVNYQNKDYINKLPFIKLPYTLHKKSRAFEVDDYAMEFNRRGLRIGDILSCSPVAVANGTPQATEPGKVYVLVTARGVFVRRLKLRAANLIFVADNPSADTLEVAPEDVLELWRVEGYFSTFLEPPLLIEERIAGLEKRMSELEAQISHLTAKSATG